MFDREPNIFGDAMQLSFVSLCGQGAVAIASLFCFFWGETVD
jgi:hypothetical protein